MIPSSGPRSQCGLGWKSNARGSPTVLITTLSCSSLPMGVRGSGMLGMTAGRLVQAALDPRAAPHPARRCARRPGASPRSSPGARPRPWLRPISLETGFRSAFRLSTCWISSRRCRPAPAPASTGDGSIWRRCIAWRTISGCSRMRLISIMAAPLLPIELKTPHTPRRTSGAPVVPPAFTVRASCKDGLTFALTGEPGPPYDGVPAGAADGVDFISTAVASHLPATLWIPY